MLDIFIIQVRTSLLPCNHWTPILYTAMNDYRICIMNVMILRKYTYHKLIELPASYFKTQQKDWNRVVNSNDCLHCSRFALLRLSLKTGCHHSTSSLIIYWSVWKPLFFSLHIAHKIWLHFCCGLLFCGYTTDSYDSFNSLRPSSAYMRQ